MLIRVVLLLASLLPSLSYAQAFKCRTSTGKVVISNEGCPSSSRLEQITTAAPVTLEGRRQAAEVNARAQYQLDGIARENAAFTQQLRRQQIAQASIDAQENQEKIRNEARERHKRCLDEAMRYREPELGRMVAACNGTPYQNENTRMNDGVLAQPSPTPRPVIKSCNGNQCSDQMGNRYTTTLGKTVNQEGKRCHQSGKVMYCD